DRRRRRPGQGPRRAARRRARRHPRRARLGARARGRLRGAVGRARRSGVDRYRPGAAGHAPARARGSERRLMRGTPGLLAHIDSFHAGSATVQAMTDTMPHRGPDDEGVWDAQGRVALGHRRLAIVDLSPAGHNPMPNEDETVWITYNG